MPLAAALSHSFAARLKQRGVEYCRHELVRIIETSRDRIKAEIKGSMPCRAASRKVVLKTVGVFGRTAHGGRARVRPAVAGCGVDLESVEAGPCCMDPARSRIIGSPPAHSTGRAFSSSDLRSSSTPRVTAQRRR